MLKILIKVLDLLMVPFVFFSGLLFKKVRMIGVRNLPACKSVLLNIGVFPLTNHYYEPQFDMRNIKHSFTKKRSLPGIKWNIQEQLELCDRLIYSHELKDVPNKRTQITEFYFNNSFFESGDAEYWYQLIRLKKPKKIIEIGSGSSTLLARKAIAKNQKEDPGYSCQHVCIEPYERPWLEEVGVTIIRSPVEEVGVDFFSMLDGNDILFIDSSHIIRPEGDVLFEYLELLPSLKKGVIVHVHDIFSPRNYLKEWLSTDVVFWNEQYLLEAFLSQNDNWKIIGALNNLHHDYFEKLASVCPYLTKDREPGSFYIQKTT
ncbi:class I SAM-dependent methyltransferase [Kiloniella antarctica]|uniref:Class I SAM-dependent methyltransferase n=1 Tax=Kiloniella antarctica TaxID=1550907 RepID=A0ABW5BP74_9PROT